MSRKAREDKSNWLTPDIYVFAGDFGPFKTRNNAPITDALVILTSTLQVHSNKKGDKRKKTKDYATDEEHTKDNRVRRHPMYSAAGYAQDLLLVEHHVDCSHNEDEKKQGGCEEDWQHSKQFHRIIIIDVATMIEAKEGEEGADNNARAEALNNIIQKEMESREPVKGFGKQLLRLLQRLNLQKVTFAAEDGFCGLLLKLYDAFLREDRATTVASDLCLIHPMLPASFVNNVLVPMGKHSQLPLDLHLIFQDEKTRDKRLGMIRHVFPNGTTSVIPGRARKEGLSLLLSMFSKKNLDNDIPEYNPEYCDAFGRSLYLSTLTVEMNKYSKQYERTTEDITADLLKVEHLTNNDGTTIDLATMDWTKCERHVGALVLRGNRIVLVRSLSGDWNGVRLPSVVQKENEPPVSAAIRSLVELTGVESSEVTALEMISPVTVYAPNGRNIVMQLYPLYATAPPPDGALEDADLEDEESPYDWYLYENASKRLDERSVAALRSMSSILVEAANVGIVPCKWGGVFGQEAVVSTATCATSSTTTLTVEPEEWTPSHKADMLQDVRKANADILSRLSANRKDGQPKKLPVTLLSGFLGSGKTTLMSHILANYDGLKIAILVNDMGEINIDAALLKKHSVSVTQREEHMVEMSNGCICCTLREDLLVEVAKIAAQGTFDYLLIESTGVSEPMPVAETFTFEDSTGLRLGDIAEIDTLVTVVDGSRFLSELDSIQTLQDRDWQADPEDQRTISHLLCDQVEFANVVIVNKCDQINTDEKNKVKRLIQQMNPSAQLIESIYSEVPLDRVLGTGLYSLADAEKHEGWLKEARIGEHTPETLEYGISSFTYRARRPFWPHKLDIVLEEMLNQAAPFDESIILRSKGIVWLASFTGIQGEFSLAGNHFNLVPGNPWWAEIDKEHWPKGLEDAIAPLWREPYGDRQQEIVIIGQKLNRDAVSKVLDECLLTEEEMCLGEEAWNHMAVDAGDPFYEDWYNAIHSAAEPGDDVEHGHSHDHHHHG